MAFDLGDFSKKLTDAGKTVANAASKAKEAYDQAQQPNQQQPPRAQTPPPPSGPPTPLPPPPPPPTPSNPLVNDSAAYGSASLRTKVGDNLQLASFKYSSVIPMGSDTLNGPDGFLWDLQKSPGHAMTFGPTRKGGKGVSAIIPALLTYVAGSRLVIDPKGENYFAVTDRALEAGHRVVLMDPWNEANRRYGSKIGVNEQVTKFNPLSALDPKSPDFADDLAAIADALIVVPDSSANKHFDEAARELVSGCIAAVVEDNPGKASLRDVRDMVTTDSAELGLRLGRIVASNPESLAARKLRRFTITNNEVENVRATAITQTAFLDSETLLDSMETDDPPFDLTELARRKVSLFLVLPVDRLETHGRWMRMIITLAIRAIARQDTPPLSPVLFMLDEMGTIGRLSMVETAFGLMAGLGIRLWGFLQDLVQLQGLYPRTWETFISNSSVIQVLKAHDPTTSAYVSNYLGNATMNAKTGGWSYKQVRWRGSEYFDDITERGQRTRERIQQQLTPAQQNAPHSSTGMREIDFQVMAFEGAIKEQREKEGKTANYNTTWVPDEQLIGRPLLDPDEVRRLPDDRLLLLVPGQFPVLQYRTIYYKHPLFEGMYRANPYYTRLVTPPPPPQPTPEA